MRTFAAAALIQVILPLVHRWAVGEERFILAQGVPLTESQCADAGRMGVREPERIRVRVVGRIPPPDRLPRVLEWLGRMTGIISPHTAGMALGHGIYVRGDWQADRYLMAHECVHTAQYERLGMREFLRQYLHECLTVGYLDAPLEREAREKAGEVG